MMSGFLSDQLMEDPIQLEETAGEEGEGFGGGVGSLHRDLRERNELEEEGIQLGNFFGGVEEGEGEGEWRAASLKAVKNTGL